ncbi:hypothetical protein [Peribacillus kribbensis]|nr:hypothetical protein [Peribacillus kribbensis]
MLLIFICFLSILGLLQIIGLDTPGKNSGELLQNEEQLKAQTMMSLDPDN